MNMRVINVKMFWKNQTHFAQHDEVIPVFSDGFMLLTVELNLSLKLRLLSFLSLPKTDVEIMNRLLSESNMCCNRRDVWCISWVIAKRLSINWNLAKRRKMWVNKLTDKMGDGNKSSCVVWSFCSRFVLKPESKPRVSAGVSVCWVDASSTTRAICHTPCPGTSTFAWVKYHNPARAGELWQEHQIFGQEGSGLVFSVKLKSNFTVKMYGLDV